MRKTEFGVTIESTSTPGVWKVSAQVLGRKKTVRLVQPVFEVSLGIEPTIDQAISVLNNARVS